MSQWGIISWGPVAWGSDGEDVIAAFAFPVLGKIMAKTQFLASEPLRVIFPPFFDKVNNAYVVAGVDTATLVVKKPSGALLVPAPVLVFDADVNFWVVEIPTTDYLEGDWLIKATSDAANTLPQYRIFTWGDYVDYIETLKKIGTGRWKVDITTKQLTLYDDDGVTPLLAFDLKGMDGLPNPHLIYERVVVP